MAQKLTGWIDYDRPRLRYLSPQERIDYFEKRVRLVVLNPVDRLLNKTKEVVGRKDSSALLIVGVAICCAIEATGKFLKGGRGSNSARFFKFLHDYMSGDYQSKSVGCMSYGQCLWKHYRNGIAHGFAVCHGGFERNLGQAYFVVKRIAGRRSLTVNPFELFSDYARGFTRYLNDLRNSNLKDKLFRDFQLVFKDVFIRGN